MVRKLDMYLAMAPSKDNLALANKVGANVLLSYHYLNNYDISTIPHDYPNIGKVFIDSGAFSAYSIGVEIDIEEYMAYLLKYDKYYHIAAGLDVIGDAEGTYKNCMLMKERGCRILPTLHFGDNIDWMDKYLEHWDYIALGGMGGGFVSKSKVTRWFDAIFSKYPDTCFHGFAVTSDELMRKYPFQSIDSASWVIKSAMAQVYSKDLRKVIMIGHSKNDYARMLDHDKKLWREQFAQAGWTYEELLEDQKARCDFNAYNYTKWNGEVIEWQPIQNQLNQWFTQEEEEIVDDFEEYRKQYPGLNERQVRLMYDHEQGYN